MVGRPKSAVGLRDGDRPDAPGACPVFVLAGGRSRRLGVDKRLLRIDGQVLLRFLYERWRDWPPVLLGGPVPARVWPGPQWPDPGPDLGPARALDAALRRWRGSAGFLSADVPWLPPAVLRRAVRSCGGAACPWDAHVFRVGRWFLPVGWVHPTALRPEPPASFQTWWTSVRCEAWDPTEVTPDGVPWWRDLDTPEDLRFWRHYWLHRGHLLQLPEDRRGLSPDVRPGSRTSGERRTDVRCRTPGTPKGRPASG